MSLCLVWLAHLVLDFFFSKQLSTTTVAFTFTLSRTTCAHVIFSYSVSQGLALLFEKLKCDFQCTKNKKNLYKNDQERNVMSLLKKQNQNA